MLRGADAVLIVEAGVPKRLEISLLPRFGLSHDRWVIFVEGSVVLFEQDLHPGLILVGRVWKDKAGDFYSFRSVEANGETCLEGDLSYSSEVIVLGLANNWSEGLDGGFEFGGNVG